MRTRQQTVRRVTAAAGVAMLCALTPSAGAADPWESVPPPDRSAGHDGFAQTVEEMPGGVGFLERMESAGRGRGCECDATTVLPDLDGDGVDDVVYSVTSSVRPYTTSFSVSSGRTGKQIGGTSTVQGFAHVVPARLGRGSHGFIYLSLALDGSKIVVTAGGVDATGTKLWERRWEEGYVLPVGSVSTWFEDAILFEEEGRTDLVVATSTTTHAPNRETSLLVLERLAGTTGETIDHATQRAPDNLRSVDLDAVEGVTAAGELDLLIQMEWWDARVTLQLRDDVSAEPTWTSSKRATYYGAFEVEAGDVAGDVAAEILLQRYRPERLIGLDGASGRRVWSIEATLHSTAPSLDGERTDLLVADSSSSDGRVALAVHRRDPRGGRVWTATVDVTARTRFRTLGGGGVWPVGDANGDGVGEVAAQVMLWDDDGRDFVPIRASRQYLLDGRTGNELGDGTGFFPLDGSITRHGTDALEFRRAGRTLELTGRDGSSGRPLWRSHLGKTTDWPPCSWDPRVLRKASGPDLLLIEIPRRHGDDEVVVDGADGEVVWET